MGMGYSRISIEATNEASTPVAPVFVTPPFGRVGQGLVDGFD